MLPYTLTAESEHCLQRIQNLRDQLDRAGPLPRSWLGRTRQDLEVEAVAASTRMEGVAVTVEEARRILAGDRPSGVDSGDAALVDGYREAMRYVLARADDPHFEWHTELILAIHHRVLAGSPAAGAGRLRDRQNWVSNSATGAQVYLPPAAEQVPDLVRVFVSRLSDFPGPAPVAAAWAHACLAAVHPFADGNGRTARVLASLVMYRAGYQAPQFTSLEEWWGRHLSAYYAAFACLGSAWRPDTDVGPFVQAHVCAQASKMAALDLRHQIDKGVWTVLVDIAVHDLGLNERTANALYDAFFNRIITNRYYRGLTGITGVTASHDLAKLVTAGLLRPDGAGRSAHYLGTDRLMHAVAAAAGLDLRAITPGTELSNQRDSVLTALAQRLHRRPQ